MKCLPEAQIVLFGLMMLTAIANLVALWSLHRISKLSRGSRSCSNMEIGQ